MNQDQEEIEHLREALLICQERLQEYRTLLTMASHVLRSKKVIVMRKDDEGESPVDLLLRRINEAGVENHQ